MQVGIKVSDQGKAEIHSCSWWHSVGGNSYYNIWRARRRKTQRTRGNTGLQPSFQGIIKGNQDEWAGQMKNLILICLSYFVYRQFVLSSVARVSWMERLACDVTCFWYVDNFSHISQGFHVTKGMCSWPPQPW